MFCEDKLCSVVNIPIEKILPNPYQPRKYFDQTALDELAVSIKEYGIIQPITVRKLPGERYELVSGERRLRASKLVKKDCIPAIIVEVCDNDSAVIALIENLQRHDLTFFEEAEGYFNLLSEHGMTQDDLAAKMGKTQSTIANKLRLLKLPAKARYCIMEHNLTERHARALLKLPNEASQMKVLQKVCDYKLNVTKTEALIEKELHQIADEQRYASLRQRRTNSKDMRIFYNTINKAIDMVNKLGVQTKTSQIEHDDYVEFVIKIPK